jgi:hypothetical protein
MKSEEFKFLIKSIIAGIIAGLIVFIITLQMSGLKFFTKTIRAGLITIILIVVLIVLNLKHSKKTRFKRPKKTIKIESSPDFDNFFWNPWYTGGDENTIGMLLTGVCKVENIVDYDIWLAAVEMRKQKFLGSILVKIDLVNSYYKIVNDPYKIRGIPKKASANIIFRLSLIPAESVIPDAKKKKENFKTDIAIIDQFGNKHWRRNIEFKYDEHQKLRREVRSQSKLVVP